MIDGHDYQHLRSATMVDLRRSLLVSYTTHLGPDILMCSDLVVVSNPHGLQPVFNSLRRLNLLPPNTVHKIISLAAHLGYARLLCERLLTLPLLT
jgi:hypothetical protein